MTDRRVPFIQRVASMLLDHLAMSFVTTGFCLLTFIPLFLLKRFVFGSLIIPQGFGLAVSFVFMGLISSVYLNKDSLGGRSPGKRMQGLVVVDFNTNRAAGPLRCLLRSFTMLLLGPIELIALLFNTNRRVGDYIARTEVVQFDQAITGEKRYSQVLFAVLIGALDFALIAFIQVVVFAIMKDSVLPMAPAWPFQ